jgi:hypothetical protein
MIRSAFLALASSSLVFLAYTRPALAIDCAALPNPVYLQVGDTQEPLMKELGRKLRDSTANPMTLVYKTSGSCTNIEALYTGGKLTTNPFYVPSTAEDAAWTTSMPSLSCTIPVEGVDLDVGVSALFVQACNPDPPPAGIALFQGPVQPYLFVVPEASTETALTSEEAYFVFGFGDQGQAKPWIDENFMFIRTSTKSTLLTLAAAIEVPADNWQGIRYDKSSEVLNAVVTSTSPAKTIGILGAEIYDLHRDTVNSLAFRAYGQRYAYYPDSTATAFDKRNVRDGHYTPWSPTVYITKVDTAGVPINPRAKYIIDLVLSRTATPTPDFDPLDVLLDVNLVPDCAMRVTRSVEGGELSLYTPLEPCGCYFESKQGGASTGCQTCTTDDPCGGGKCRKQFCESQ